MGRFTLSQESCQASTPRFRPLVIRANRNTATVKRVLFERISADLWGGKSGDLGMDRDGNILLPVFNNQGRRLGGKLEAFPLTASLPE